VQRGATARVLQGKKNFGGGEAFGSGRARVWEERKKVAEIKDVLGTIQAGFRKFKGAAPHKKGGKTWKLLTHAAV